MIKHLFSIFLYFQPVRKKISSETPCSHIYLAARLLASFYPILLAYIYVRTYMYYTLASEQVKNHRVLFLHPIVAFLSIYSGDDLIFCSLSLSILDGKSFITQRVFLSSTPKVDIMPLNCVCTTSVNSLFVCLFFNMTIVYF